MSNRHQLEPKSCWKREGSLHPRCWYRTWSAGGRGTSCWMNQSILKSWYFHLKLVIKRSYPVHSLGITPSPVWRKQTKATLANGTAHGQRAQQELVPSQRRQQGLLILTIPIIDKPQKASSGETFACRQQNSNIPSLQWQKRSPIFILQIKSFGSDAKRKVVGKLHPWKFHPHLNYRLASPCFLHPERWITAQELSSMRAEASNNPNGTPTYKQGNLKFRL